MCVCVSRRLSASAVHVTEMEEADQSLSRQLRQHSMSSSLDTHTLRIRKMSLDNRYVHTQHTGIANVDIDVFSFRWVQ